MSAHGGPSPRIYPHFDSEVADQLRIVACEQGITMAGLVRELVAAGLAALRDQPAPPPEGLMVIAHQVEDTCPSCGAPPPPDELAAAVYRAARTQQDAYCRSWRVFTRWCSDHQIDPVRAGVSDLLAYVSDTFAAGLSPYTAHNRVTAVGAVYRAAGRRPNPAHAPELRRVLNEALRPGVPRRSPFTDGGAPCLRREIDEGVGVEADERRFGGDPPTIHHLTSKRE